MRRRAAASCARKSWVASLAIASLVLPGCGGTTPSAQMRNIVLICLDTVRFDTLALVNDEFDSDEASRWWRRATSVAGAQSSAPWTLPSVASAFTGLYPNEHGAGAFRRPIANLDKHLPAPLASTTPTLTTVLAEHGFETVGIVAHTWFRDRFGLRRGFSQIDFEVHEDREVVNKARAWLRRRVDSGTTERFFLYLHFMDAHKPPNLVFRRDLAERAGALPVSLRDRANEEIPTACAKFERRPARLDCLRYLAYVEAVVRLRSAVAEVLDELESLDLLDETAVALFSDHGEEFYDHTREESERALDPRGVYGLGHGHSLFQELLHVPLVFWHPRLSPGPRDVPASLVDLMPTLLGWVGVDAPALQRAGVDLHASLAGEPGDPERPLFSSSVSFGPEREAVVRAGRKLISDAPSGAGRLAYDLVRDPGERAPIDPQGVSDLDALLGAYRRDARAAGAPARPSPEEIEALQALGYLKDVGE